MADVPVSAVDLLKRKIARFQHSNESLHRHPNPSAPTCMYCDLVAHYAVKTMLANPELVRDALALIEQEA